jgi:hypothetical protein
MPPVTRARRALSALATLALLAGGLAALTATAPPAAAETFAERWCSDAHPAPCVESATRNGVPLTSADPSVDITMIGVQHLDDFDYTEFIVQPLAGELSPSDTYSVLIDLGTLKPDYTEAYAGLPVAQRIEDGDGTYQLRYTGSPVLVTSGCNDAYPVSCPTVASGQQVTLEAEVHQLKTNLEFRGFDRSQNVDGVNGIFLEKDGEGHYELTSDWYNSHVLTDGTTVVHGQARFRVPFSMLEDEFGVPDPATMVPSSFKGRVNGKPAAFSFTLDPAGGAFFVDISGVTFSKKTVTIARGTITPTRPRLRKAHRTGPRVVLAFGKATPRGAKVTGYQARCAANGTTTRTASGRRLRLVVRGLSAGRTYTCRVRAASKAGYGAWSKAIKV